MLPAGGCICQSLNTNSLPAFVAYFSCLYESSPLGFRREVAGINILYPSYSEEWTTFCW